MKTDPVSIKYHCSKWAIFRLNLFEYTSYIEHSVSYVKHLIICKLVENETLIFNLKINVTSISVVLIISLRKGTFFNHISSRIFVQNLGSISEWCWLPKTEPIYCRQSNWRFFTTLRLLKMLIGYFHEFLYMNPFQQVFDQFIDAWIDDSTCAYPFFLWP